MTLHSTFPTDPFVVLDPSIRWVPGDIDLQEVGKLEKLIPPLVHQIRCNVKQWREQNYAGASWTTRALLTHWFQSTHWIGSNYKENRQFRWYFAQQEAVESAVWLYEIMKCKDSRSLFQFDSSGLLSSQDFMEPWPRYVMKLATGSGKTKIISLLLTWCYFHRLYEKNSDLSTNFLLIAPNIIVLDRLKVDFMGLKIFRDDPLIPENGYLGKNWQYDFHPTLHIQDDIGTISPYGNIYLTNIHRLFVSNKQLTSADDKDTRDYFLGLKPSGNTSDSKLDLGILIREVPDLVIFNDEAHHIHDDRLAWNQTICEIHKALVGKGHKLSAQFDVTATPKHTNGAIFAQTISDYPLCEAIHQGVVKQPVIPDDASMAKLQETTSSNFVERYEDHINLGYIEWRKTYDQLKSLGKKSVLFIMTDETANCDKVKDYLENTYPDLIGAILVIHTKRDGTIDESKGFDLDELRKASREIDHWDNPYKVIISVMMLREGWDVQNVTTIVGLRSYSALSKILPEQTLGRGLRRMFRGHPIEEEPKLSVIGTQAFIDFVKSIKTEGVDLDYRAMGEGTPVKAPLIIQIDEDKRDLKELEITLPILVPRMHRDWKDLNNLNPEMLLESPIKLRIYSADEQRQITFMDINTNELSHITDMPSHFVPDYHRALHFFTQTIMRDLRLVGGLEILYGKLKTFIENYLFGHRVNLNDLNILRNLSEPYVRRVIVDNFKEAINQLTVSERGTTEIRDSIQISKTRPFQVKEDTYFRPTKSLFTKIVGDSSFELDFARFLDACSDVLAFVKNNQAIGFYIDYCNAEGRIANYFPDFIIKRSEKEIWIIELKGREDIQDIHKRERLEQYCHDVTKLEQGRRSFCSLYLKQEDWERYRPRNFEELIMFAK